MADKPSGATQETARNDPKKLTHADFEKIELRVGKIVGVKEHSNDKDYILKIDFGPVEQDIQIVADLKESYTMDDLMNKQVIVMLNIVHEVVSGVDSQGLLLITTKDKKPVLVSPEKEVPTGVKVYGIMDSMCGHFDDIGQ